MAVRVVARVVVADATAERGRAGIRPRTGFAWNAGRRATLAEVRQIDDVVLPRYGLSPRFRDD